MIYYEDDCGKLILGDFTQNLEKESVDLIITSPPYDGLRNYKGYVFDIQDAAKPLFNCLKYGGVMVWIVKDQTKDGNKTGTSFRQALTFQEAGFKMWDLMIYAKRGFSNPEKVRYHNVFEFMFVFSKGKVKTFNPIMDKPNKNAGQRGNWGKNTQRQKDGTLKENPQRGLTANYGKRYNIWYYNTGKGHSSSDEEAFKHPAIMPEHLVHDHVVSWSNEGDIVLDPMVGSGTTVKVAKALNRNYIGIDTSETYLKDCCIPRLKRTKTGDINAIHFQKQSPAIP